MKRAGRETLALALATFASGAAPGTAPDEPARPNVILIVTDDQGFGDFSSNGNPVLATPRLDRLRAESVELGCFAVSPVCVPARASLLTGRYSHRTGAFSSRANLAPDEVTLAERFAQAGYRTAIHGKWHLGDNYPMRPQDQGFDETVVLRGGALGIIADPPEGNSNFDPWLWEDGRRVRFEGFSTDVLTDLAIEFVGRDHERPFFLYLPYNTPHNPLEAPEELWRPYAAQDLSAGRFPAVGRPLPRRLPTEDTALVYGMVASIDANVGRLLDALDELELADDTLVVFLSDNGPQHPRFNAGLRAIKGSVFEGGIRTPCWWRWPGVLEPGRVLPRPTAHIDVAPTLVTLCGLAADDPEPLDERFDGRDLSPWLLGDERPWPERTLFCQWHTGDVPELWRNAMVRTGEWKLVQAAGAGAPIEEQRRRFALFHIATDPYELHDVASDHPEIVADLSARYGVWFADVTAGRRAIEPIVLGTEHENPTWLTRQDWRGMRGFGPLDVGHWVVDVARAGVWSVELRFPAADVARTLELSFGGVRARADVAAGRETHRFGDLTPALGRTRLAAELRASDGQRFGVHYATVERRER